MQSKNINITNLASWQKTTNFPKGVGRNSGDDFFKSKGRNMSEYKTENLRFIVFLLDNKYKDHDGKVFMSLIEAKEFALETMRDQYADKCIIGSFVELGQKEQMIHNIKTFGFKGDKKNLQQLELFI